MKQSDPTPPFCSIAQSLHVLGNRWALLILRDLHAGPATFGELMKGLDGIATNMLSSRLTELIEAQLIEKTARQYRLTANGFGTQGILFELARFSFLAGNGPQADENINIRSRIVILTGALCRAVSKHDQLRAEIWLNEEPFGLTIANGEVAIVSGLMPLTPVTLYFTWSDMEAVARGDKRVSDFAADRKISAQDPLQVAGLLDLLQKAMDIYGGFA